MVDLWIACRLRKDAALPTAGGVGDQPAALMDEFRLLDALSQES